MNKTAKLAYLEGYMEKVSLMGAGPLKAMALWGGPRETASLGNKLLGSKYSEPYTKEIVDKLLKRVRLNTQMLDGSVTASDPARAIRRLKGRYGRTLQREVTLKMLGDVQRGQRIPEGQLLARLNRPAQRMVD